VEIQTEAPGLSTEEVEALITVPIENALSGIAWLDTMRSKSLLGLSSVVLVFQERADLLRARQLVQEQLTAVVAQLPKVASSPTLLPPVSATAGVMKIGMTSGSRSQMDISEAARWVVWPRLMAVPGVASVSIWGERPAQYQVVVDPERREHAAGDARRDRPRRDRRDGHQRGRLPRHAEPAPAGASRGDDRDPPRTCRRRSCSTGTEPRCGSATWRRSPSDIRRRSGTRSSTTVRGSSSSSTSSPGATRWR
jgi:hypothetical protein